MNLVLRLEWNNDDYVVNVIKKFSVVKYLIAVSNCFSKLSQFNF
jgi:hypothetical protein